MFFKIYLMVSALSCVLAFQLSTMRSRNSILFTSTVEKVEKGLHRKVLTPLSVGDYAAEITNAVGSEIYGPIFKAGLFLIVSGIFSAAAVSLIISKSDSWTELGEEFERGKESQLTGMSSAIADSKLVSLDSSTPTKNSPNSVESQVEGSNKEISLLDL